MARGASTKLPASESVPGDELELLDSWKEIASFFKREVRTVQLWEQHEDLPVHRHQHRKVGTVHAYKAELRKWWKTRCAQQQNGRSSSTGLSRAAAASIGMQPQITLAVTPFEFADSDFSSSVSNTNLTEQISAQLDTLLPSRLRVICSLAVAQRHAEGSRLGDEKEEREADYQLRGKVNVSGNSLSIETELVRPDSQIAIWSKIFEYPCDTCSELHVDLAEKVARAVSNHLLMAGRPSASNSVDPAARYAYLRGRYLWSLRSSGSSMREAMKQFQLATTLDPNHASAFSGLADCYAVLGWLGAIPRQIAMLQARKAALRALAIDDSLAEGHVSMGCVHFDYDWDWEGAERELLRGINLNPAYAQAYCWYGQVLIALGRSQEALRAAQIAQDMDPVTPMVGVFMGSALFHASQYDAAIRQFQHVVQIQPAHAFAHSRLGLAYVQAGEYRLGIEHLRIAAASPENDGTTQATLAYAHARAGDCHEAKALLASIDQGDGEAVLALDAAAAYTALGDHDTAMQYLNRGFNDRNIRLTRLKCDPRLLALHSDQRFTSLTRQMHLD